MNNVNFNRLKYLIKDNPVTLITKPAKTSLMSNLLDLVSGNCVLITDNPNKEMIDLSKCEETINNSDKLKIYICNDEEISKDGLFHFLWKICHDNQTNKIILDLSFLFSNETSNSSTQNHIFGFLYKWTTESKDRSVIIGVEEPHNLKDNISYKFYFHLITEAESEDNFKIVKCIHK